jgi:hypothetical protein
VARPSPSPSPAKMGLKSDSSPESEYYKSGYRRVTFTNTFPNAGHRKSVTRYTITFLTRKQAHFSTVLAHLVTTDLVNVISYAKYLVDGYQENNGTLLQENEGVLSTVLIICWKYNADVIHQNVKSYNNWRHVQSMA